jgi:hypothetical protein
MFLKSNNVLCFQRVLLILLWLQNLNKCTDFVVSTEWIPRAEYRQIIITPLYRIADVQRYFLYNNVVPWREI